MSNTFDLTQKRIQKILEDKHQAQAAFGQLITEMQQAKQSADLTQRFCLKAFHIKSATEIVELLDDFFLDDIRAQWHLHVSKARIPDQLSHRLTSYSESMARKMLSHTIVDGQLEYSEIPEKTMTWLFGKSQSQAPVKIILMGDTLKEGFLVLRLDTNAVHLNRTSLSFLGRACLILLDKFLV